MEHPDLKLAIRLNTAKERENAVCDFITRSLQALKQAKEGKTSLRILPNWKFKTEEEAVKFLREATTLLKMATKEEFHLCRIGTDEVGHLLLMFVWGITETEFIKMMNDIQGKVGHECGHCGNEAADRKCGGCGEKHYCDEKCQRADWKAHKEACKAASRRYKSVGLTVM